MLRFQQELDNFGSANQNIIVDMEMGTRYEVSIARNDRDGYRKELSEFVYAVKEYVELSTLPVDKLLEGNKYARLAQLKELIMPFLQEVE